MEVRKGYKQTEVGIIPEEWDVISIGEVSKIFGRIGFRGYTINDIVKEGEGAITISPSNIQDNKTDFSNCTYISWYKYEESPEIKIENGDILLVKTGSTVGKTAIVKNLPERATINPQIVVLKKVKINNIFLGYNMGFEVIQGQLKSTTVGGALPTLSQKQVAQFKFPLPATVAEQEAIAEALSDADALIESLETLLAKKRQVKQGAMSELLTGKRRLSGFSGEWKNTSIGNEIDLLTGFPFQSNQYTSSGIRLLRCSNIKRGQTDWSDEITQFWGEVTPDLIPYSLKEGDLVIAMDGSLVGRSYARLTKNDLPALLLQRVARIRSKKIDVGYLHQFIGSNYFVKYSDSVKTVTAIPHISPSDIRNFEIPLPPTLTEQTAIAEILSDMDAEIRALEGKLSKARAVKAGMMSELLTGRTRLV